MFANAGVYDAIVAAAAARTGVPLEILKGVIAVESGFSERATHYDSNVNDTSYGLMQVRYQVAQQLGYLGSPDGLFNPETNIGLGAQLLASNYRRAGLWDVAIAAYNAGWSKERLNDAPRHPDASFWTADPNYVAKVLNYARQFAPPSADDPPMDDATGSTLPPAALVSFLALGLSLAVWWLRQRGQG